MPGTSKSFKKLDSHMQGFQLMFPIISCYLNVTRKKGTSRGLFSQLCELWIVTVTLEMSTTIGYRVNWGFKLTVKISFKLDEMHINLIASIIFILQVLEEDAWNKKLCIIHIIYIKDNQICKVVTNFTFIFKYFCHYMMS